MTHPMSEPWVDWKSENATPAPPETAVLVWDGDVIAVGRKLKGGMWMIDNSFGFNEDGEISGVTHWAPLPAPPLS